jgi:hypothetical protein
MFSNDNGEQGNGRHINEFVAPQVLPFSLRGMYTVQAFLHTDDIRFGDIHDFLL